MIRRIVLALALAPLLGCARTEVAAQPHNCEMLCGVVLDAATSKPIQKYTLVLYTRDQRAGRPMFALPHGYPYPPGRLLQSIQISSSSGDFNLPSLGVTSVLLSISAPEHLLYQSSEIQMPSHNPLELRLARAWEVSGKVVDQRGVGVARAAIYPDAPTPFDEWIHTLHEMAPLTQTDSNGRFTLNDIQSFQRDTGVVVLRSGFVPRRVGIPIAGPRTSFDISLEPAVAVSGSVADNSGHPAANVSIEAKPIAGGEVRRAITRSDGRFAFDALPRKKVHFAASRLLRENPVEGRLELGYASHTDVDLAAGQEIRLMLPASGSLRGTMTGLAREATGYEIHVRCGDWSSTAPAGTHGEFFELAPAGDCDITGSFSDSMSRFETDSKRVVIADGSDGTVNLQFGNPTELRITLNSVPIQSQVSIARAGGSPPVARLLPDRGGYRFAGLLSGQYDATFESFEGAYRVPLDIGSRAEFVFDLKTAPAQLSVVGDENQPLRTTVTILRPHYAERFPQPVDPGKFMRFLPFGEYELKIESRGYEPRNVTFRVPGEPQVVTMKPLPLPFSHPPVAEAIADDEREVLAVVLQDFEKRMDKPGVLVLMNQTAQPRLEVGFVYDSGDVPSKQQLARIKGSPAFVVFEQHWREVRSLDALGQRSIRPLPFHRMPLQRPEYRHDMNIEIEMIDGEAFQKNFPDAAGLVTLSRAGIVGDEAVVSASLLPGLGVDERLIRLRRIGGLWRITESVLLASTPGC